MNVHEFQAKNVLRKFGIPIPNFRVVSSVGEAKQVVDELNLETAVVKVQVHAGGRGKAGGVRLVDTATEAECASHACLVHS